MAYADLAALKARAGALANAWTATSNPDDDQVSGFLDDVAAEIDALLVARGATPPVAGTAGAGALRNINADGALLLALEATYPEGSGPSSASSLIDTVRARWEEARGELLAGTLPALALLESASSAPHASSFWENEGDSFGQSSVQDSRDRNPFVSAGPVGRGERF